jgi:hypothetical protein
MTDPSSPCDTGSKQPGELMARVQMLATVVRPLQLRMQNLTAWDCQWLVNKSNQGTK